MAREEKTSDIRDEILSKDSRKTNEEHDKTIRGRGYSGARKKKKKM